MNTRRLLVGIAAGSLFATCLAAGAAASPPRALPFGIHVSGNRLVDDQTGAVVQLRGINQMASAGCTGARHQDAMIYGPSGPSSLTALARWHVNVVRLTANEDCWLGINGVPRATGGAAYRRVLTDYVRLLTAHRYYVIFDLHVNAPGTVLSNAEQPMADADHAPAFWSSVAATFRGDPAVIFEPYNEPHVTTSDAATTDPWACWLDGCRATEVSTAPHAGHPASWQLAGMARLVDAIRATGATNVITLSGLDMANDLSGLLAHLPVDRDHQLAATFHNYGTSATVNEGCGPSCWRTTIAAVAARLPVITDELGESDCATSYVTAYMTWADAHGVSYLPWGWELWGCAHHAYGVLADWSGTPNSYGLAFYRHFAARAGADGSAR